MARLTVCNECGAEISKKSKRCPMCGAKNKKPVYKRWWFWFLILALLGSCGKKDEEPTSKQDAFGSNQETVISDNNEVEPEITEPEQEDETVPSIEEPFRIELVAGEKGEYGEPYAVNEGTEFEENYFVYRVPAGTYTVTNTGEYMNQFNVYSEELRVTDAGWEEPAETFACLLLDVGETGTVKIEDGQIIEIHEPGKFMLEETDEALVEDATEETAEEKEPAIEEPEEITTATVETPAAPSTAVDTQTPAPTPEPPVVETPAVEPEQTVEDEPVFVPVVVDPLSGGAVTTPEYEEPIYQEPTYQEPIYQEPIQAGNDYVINVNSGKYHYAWCDSVGRMAEHNKSYYTGASSDITAMGYIPCENCNP